MTNADIAEERGLTLNPSTNTYYDESGNEYRDENGECLTGEVATIKQRVEQIHRSLDDENISYSEIAELDGIAKQLGIKQTDEMMAVDVLLEVEDKLNDS